MSAKPKIVWTDLDKWKTEGKGWSDTPKRYSRLPKKAKKTVTEEVWRLSGSSTGMFVVFESNAQEIQVRWKLSSAQLNQMNFPAAGFSGFDLYAQEKGKWLWAGVTDKHTGIKNCETIVSGMEGKKRKFMLYFPLRNRPEKVELGVPAGSTLKQVPVKAKPIAYYGTSIVHGAFSSHAGMVHTSILSRWLDRPMINLGFSGVARMEPAIAELLAELDVEMYVLDPLPNMDLALTKERAENFIRLLRKLKPKTPIVLVEDRPQTNAWIRVALMREHEEKWRFYQSLYKKLCKEGMRNIYYIKGRDLFGTDHEASTDSSHPSDLGYMRMAEKLLPTLKKVLGKA